MRISVIIPCHNAEDYLAQTLGSVLDQTRPADQIIVVDDGSTDQSQAIARQFAAADPRIYVVAQRSGSATCTRLIGMSQADGDALMFLDADDVLGPDALEALSQALIDEPGSIAICPWYRLEQVNDVWVSKPASCVPWSRHYSPLGNWLRGWYHPPCSVLWSREAYECSGGWDPRSRGNDDGDIIMRALVRRTPLVHVNRGAGYYRRLPDGQISLSGRRFTETGLSSRMRAADKVRWLAAERKQLGEPRLRAALSVSYRQIAADARDESPDISRQALDRAASVEPGPMWRTAHAVHHLAARAARSIQRLGQAPAASAPQMPSTDSALEEIRYGLDRAEAILKNQPTHLQPAVSANLPQVSVVIPTYNRADMLLRAVKSVLAQSFTDFELLVVDDGSTDDTEARVMAIGDHRLRYLKQPRNQGVAAARNRGLREARARYIAFLDSDDEWREDKLALQVERFAECPQEVGLIYTGVKGVLPGDKESIKCSIARGDVFHNMLQSNLLHGAPSNGMIRRSVLATVGFFDETLPAIEDYDYWLRLTRFFEVDVIDQPLSVYHEPQNIARRSLDLQKNLEARAMFYRKYRHLMKRHAVAHLFLLDSANRCLASSAPRYFQACRLSIRACCIKCDVPTLTHAARYLAMICRVHEPLRRLVRRSSLRDNKSSLSAEEHHN